MNEYTEEYDVSNYTEPLRIIRQRDINGFLPEIRSAYIPAGFKLEAFGPDFKTVTGITSTYYIVKNSFPMVDYNYDNLYEPDSIIISRI